MPVVHIQDGIVVQRWDDVHLLSEFEAKYGPTHDGIMVGDAWPGQVSSGGGFMNPEPVVRPANKEDVNNECKRRINSFLGVTTQIDALAKQQSYSNLLYKYRLRVERGETLSTEEQERSTAIEAGYDYIMAIVDASNVLTAMDPIPSGYSADIHWPLPPA